MNYQKLEDYHNRARLTRETFEKDMAMDEEQSYNMHLQDVKSRIEK